MNQKRVAARLLAWMVAAVLPLVPASCRDIVAGDATNLPVELCELLDDCEGGCAEDLLARVEAATPEERQGLLAYAAEVDCLGTCVGARSCRDHAPICHPTDEPCVESYDCCGFTVGASLCEEVVQKCCLALGAVCVAGSTSCCGGELCPNNGRCGGFVCTLTVEQVEELDEAACADPSECCSQRCEGGHCVANTCSSPGEPCTVEADCCPQTGANGVSIQPICSDQGKCASPNVGTCDVCVPSEDPSVDCCRDEGGVCYDFLDGTGCDASGCTPLGASCTSDAECCLVNDAPTFCDANSVPPRCATEAPCITEQGGCRVDSDCCQGKCTATKCRACVPPADHSPCATGGPLASDSNDSIVKEVCAQAVSQSCCCIGWGALCVTAYKARGGSCPITPGN